MNWEAIGAVGEIGGAAGVIITLVYLAIQVRSSAKATESQVHASLSSEMQRLLVAASQDQALVEIMLLVQRNEEPTAVQSMQLRLWFGGFLRVCESHIIQRQLDATTLEVEKPIAAILQQFARSDFYREIMIEAVRNGTATPGFLSWVDAQVLAQTHSD